MQRKYLCHVPTESYGFISVELDGDADEAVEAYKELQAAWNALRDNYLLTGQMDGDPGELEKLSPQQKYWVNETKKALAGIKRKLYN